MSGPITKNGIHPITGKGATVEHVGTTGAAKPSTPNVAQVAASGAKNDAGGKFHAPVKKPAMEGKVAAAETLANKLYPSSTGLRGAKE